MNDKALTTCPELSGNTLKINPASPVSSQAKGKMSKKTTVIVFILFFITISSFAQFNSKFKKLYKHADDYVYMENYAKALPIFLKLDSMVPNNSNISFSIGRCYLNSYNNKILAIPYLEKACKNVSLDYYGDFNEETASVFAFYYLAQIYHFNYQFDEAIETFNKFKYYLTSEDKALLLKVNRYIEMCYVGKKLILTPIKIRTISLGDAINSKYSEYAPVLTSDGKSMFFTTRRPKTINDERGLDGLYFEDVYFSEYNSETKDWSQALPIKNINTEKHEATISISNNGKALFVYKCVKGNGDIYISYKKNDKWSLLEKMEAPINTKAYENNACLTTDENIIYFISDRKGGYGGKDIWASEKNSNGEWDEPKNLGSKINSQYDEDSPFILSDNKTLYFCSKGHENMGGYDIFISRLQKNGEWELPKNIGFPINTPDDDLFFFPMLDGTVAYYSSEQKGGKGKMDIYKIIIEKEIEQQVTTLCGLIVDTINKQPYKGIISARNIETNETTASANTNNKNGEYYMSLPQGVNYELIVNTPEDELRDTVSIAKKTDVKKEEFNLNDPFNMRYLDVSAAPLDTVIHNISFGRYIKKDIGDIGDRIVLRKVYYDFNKSTLRPESKEELEKLIYFLNKNSTINIILLGHTDYIGTDEYNQKLSEDRVKNVVNYLIDNGISEDRLNYTGYGEKTPIATNLTDEGRQLNRRTEFKITGITETDNFIVQYDTTYYGNIAYDDNAINNNFSNVSNNNNKFYVIAGSFSFYKNAVRSKTKLIKQGYKNAEIIGGNSIGTFRVAYNSYSSKEEALKSLEIIKKDTGTESIWIYTIE